MGQQKISVILKNGKPDNIPTHLLGLMIASGEVTQFQRSSGWVTVGKDSIRGDVANYAYFGPEKRKPQQQKQCIKCPSLIDDACIHNTCTYRYIQVNC